MRTEQEIREMIDIVDDFAVENKVETIAVIKTLIWVLGEDL